jgi:drug/metabolite transporter (DMT)-like permease
VDRQSQFKNRIFIALLVVSNTLGNLFLGLGMKAMPDFDAVRFLDYTRVFLTNPWIIAGILLLIFWMLTQLSMFSWADLSYVLPVTASAYVFTAILGKFFLLERISMARWAGVVLISFGVLLVSETPPWTHPQPPREEEP